MGEYCDNLQTAAVRTMRRAQWFLMSLPMAIDQWQIDGIDSASERIY